MARRLSRDSPRVTLRAVPGTRDRLARAPAPLGSATPPTLEATMSWSDSSPLPEDSRSVRRVRGAGASRREAQTPAEVGQWSSVMSWPISATHTHLQPDGKVMFFGEFDEGLDPPRLWDPATGAAHGAARAGLQHLLRGPLLPRGRPAAGHGGARRRATWGSRREPLRSLHAHVDPPAGHERGPLVPHQHHAAQRGRAGALRGDDRHRRHATRCPSGTWRPAGPGGP